VADIAAAHGKSSFLTAGSMLYCLFKHGAAQAVRDLAVRVGERFLIRRVSLRMIQAVLKKVWVRITQRLASKAIARWLPIVGAIGIGAYAYYDTAQVGKTAVGLFGQKLDIEPEKN
jgi:hypothetical protein